METLIFIAIVVAAIIFSGNQSKAGDRRQHKPN